MKPVIVWVGELAPDAQAALQPALGGAGYRLRLSAQGAPDADLLGQPDVGAVVVDMTHPGLNGALLCGQIKVRDSSVRVVALHRGEEYLRQAALAAGADVVYRHPLNPTALVAWLSKDAPRLLSVTESMLGDSSDDALDTTAILMHDLKSPISIIISTLEVVMTFHDSDESFASTLRLLRGALSAAYRQMFLVTDMFDLVRLSKGAYELERHPCNLVELVSDFMQAEAETLADKKLHYVLDMPPTALVASVDAQLFERMCWALLDNVMKFNVHSDSLYVSAKAEGDRVQVIFSDTGRPVFAGYERRVLETPPRWSDRQAGTRTSVALGLPFVYAAAKAQDGDIRVATDPTTHRTTFTLSFPAYSAG